MLILTTNAASSFLLLITFSIKSKTTSDRAGYPKTYYKLLWINILVQVPNPKGGYDILGD